MQLGDRARSKIDGMEGVITGTVRHLTGCDQVILQPGYNVKDGKLPNSHWVDVMAVEVIESGAVVIPRPPDVPSAG